MLPLFLLVLAIASTAATSPAAAWPGKKKTALEPQVTLAREQTARQIVSRFAREQGKRGRRFKLWRQAMTQVIVQHTARVEVPVSQLEALLRQPAAQQLSLEAIVGLIPEREDKDYYTKRWDWLRRGREKLQKVGAKPFTNREVFVNAYRCQADLCGVIGEYRKLGVSTQGAAVEGYGSLLQGTFTAQSDLDFHWWTAPGAEDRTPPFSNPSGGIYASYPRVDFQGMVPKTEQEKKFAASFWARHSIFAPVFAPPPSAAPETQFARLHAETARLFPVTALERDPHLIAKILAEKLAGIGLEPGMLERARRAAFAEVQREGRSSGPLDPAK